MTKNSGIGAGPGLAIAAAATVVVVGGGYFLAQSGVFGSEVRYEVERRMAVLGLVNMPAPLVPRVPTPVLAPLNSETEGATASQSDEAASEAPAVAMLADEGAAAEDTVPQTTQAAPVSEPAADAASTEAVFQLMAPVLELARFEADGAGLIAGSAQEGVEVQVLLDGKVLDQQVVPAGGEFVSFVTIDPSNELRVVSLVARFDGQQMMSEDTFILAPVASQVATAATDGSTAEVTAETAAEATKGSTTDTTTDTSTATVQAEAVPEPQSQPQSQPLSGSELVAEAEPDTATSSAEQGNAAPEPEPVELALLDKPTDETVTAASEDAAEAPDAQIPTEAPASAPTRVEGEGDAPTATPDAALDAAQDTPDPARAGAEDASETDAASDDEAAPVVATATGTETETDTDAESATVTGTEIAPQVDVDTPVETAQLPTAEAAQSSPQPTAPSDIAATTPAEPAAPGTEQAVSPAVTAPVTTAPQATAEAGAEPDAAAQEDAVVADAASAPRPEVAVAVLRANKDGVTLVQPATPVAPELLDKIALDTISYTDAGDVQLAGRARPEALVRVYLDNSPVADITADAAGRWSGSLTAITPGIYTLRLDEIDPVEGKVLSRLETPFKREAPEVLQPVLDANAAAADAGQPAVQAVTVQKGDTLWAISQERYGSGFLFVRVFEANKSDIRDPDLIYPGQIFTLPD